MIIGRPIEKVIDFIGEFLAMGTVILLIVMYINSLLMSKGLPGFIPADKLDFMKSLREYAIVAVVGLKALEFALKRNVILAIICFAIIAAAVILVMLPGAALGA